jgi:hypothetical protein
VRRWAIWLLAIFSFMQSASAAEVARSRVEVARAFIQKIAPVIPKGKSDLREDRKEQFARLESSVAAGLAISFAEPGSDGWFPHFILHSWEIKTPSERGEAIKMALRYMENLGLLGDVFGNTQFSAKSAGRDKRAPSYPSYAKWINWSLCYEDGPVVKCQQPYNPFATPPPGVVANFLFSSSGEKLENLTFYFTSKDWSEAIYALKKRLPAEPRASN